MEPPRGTRAIGEPQIWLYKTKWETWMVTWFIVHAIRASQLLKRSTTLGP